MYILIMDNQKTWYLVFACWIIASLSLLGSLFFSEIMEFPPCVMCWYQRIAMYPLSLIFLVSLFSFDRSVIKYSSPLVGIGWALAFWHNLLQWGVIPKNAAPCQEGLPCATRYLDWGIITIPFLSLLAFSLIAVLLIKLYLLNGKSNEK